MILKSSERKYLFSVIVPIYNVEEFLEDAIESVVQQSIGFKEHIQMVLVNDGSPDHSEEICLKYKEWYPDNVVYVKKENGGVSSARNEGMAYIAGKYVNFLDSDDKWALDAFEKVAAFFEAHEKEIDVVSTRTCYFGKREGFGHYLDFKYTDDRIVDINIEYSAIQMAVNNVFIKSDALNGHHFDTRLKVSEDSIFIAKIILEKEKYGLLRSGVYYYRKRSLGGSALDNRTNNKSWYFDTTDYCYKELFRLSEEQYGCVIPFLQYHVMNDIQWRLSMQISESLTEEEVERYKTEMGLLLEKIEDSIIMEQKSINFAYKIFALNLKYGRNILKESEKKGNWYVFRDTKVFNICAPSRFRIEFLSIQKDILQLEGFCELGILDGGNEAIFWKDEGENLHPITMRKVPRWKQKNFLGQPIFSGLAFSLKIPLKERMKITFVMKRGESAPIILKPFMGIGAKVSRELGQSYYAKDAYLLKYKNETFSVYKNRLKTRLASELRYCKTLINEGKKRFVLRHFLSVTCPKDKKKAIWIIMDKPTVSGHNVESLMSYLKGEDLSHIDRIYIIRGKERVELGKLNKYGIVLEPESIDYETVFLQAEKVITTRPGSRGFVDPKDDVELLKNLYTFEYIFLD